MTGRTFLLGLGAQKAGTSWLHDYAASDAKSDFGPLKEYHIWDALELPGLGHHDMRPQRPLNRALQRLICTVRRSDPAAWRLRGVLQAGPEQYFDYFAGLLDNPGIHLTGDITPAYAGLSEPTLMQLRTGFAERGVDVKVVFLMRDPVARAISAARMNRRKRDWREGVPPFGDFDRALLTYARSSGHNLRANYARTVSCARAVFKPEQIHFEFYTTMFQPARLKQLSDFLGVSFRPERISKKRYASGNKAVNVSTKTEAALREILDPIYRDCAELFPETVELWRT